MKRLAVLMILAGLSSLSGACLADEPAFCKSMCTSEKNQCRAIAVAKQEKEGRSLVDMPEKNPLARTAQVQMGSSDAGALEKSGYEHRRMTRASACEDAWQRCTRECSVPKGTDAEGAVVSRHAKKSG